MYQGFGRSCLVSETNRYCENMNVDDNESPLSKINSNKLAEFQKYQQTLPDPTRKTERFVGKIKSNGFNNGNEVLMGPYGGFFYYNRVSGVKTPIKKGQKVEFSENEWNENFINMKVLIKILILKINLQNKIYWKQSKSAR